MHPVSTDGCLVRERSASGCESLFDLQLQVARKADDIVRTQNLTGHLNLQCWLLAEAEVLRGYIAGSTPFAAR